MKQINYCLKLCLLMSMTWSLHGGCNLPASKERIWDAAGNALIFMQEIESIVSQLLLDVDFDGTFTVIDRILSSICTSETLAESINSNLDQLLVSFDTTLEQLAVAESKTAQLLTNVELLSIDMLATFTALEELQRSISSKLDLVAKDLQTVESHVQLLIETEIDQQITVASHLNVLQTDIDLLNSALDSLTIIDGINQMSSSIAMISSLTDSIEVGVNNLQELIQTDFSGTWTALDAQLMLACTVESLVDNLNVTTQMTDFSGVYTSLLALQERIEQIDSMVDLITIVNSENLVCTIASKIDIALSKLSMAQQVILPLPDLGGSIISLLASDNVLLHSASSALDITIRLLSSIQSKVDTIISKVSVIEGELVTNNSDLEVVLKELLTIDSSLDSLDATASKLIVIDSQVDALEREAITIESLVDGINHLALSIDSKIDTFHMVSKSVLIASELATIANNTVTISSKLDLVIGDENTINSVLDIITHEAQSSLNLLSTVGSKINVIESKLELSSGIALNSKLAVINNEASTISSKMVIVDADIAGLIFTAQDLATDFQETWTILDSISNILRSDQLGLQTISSKLSNLNLVDFSGVYTVINSIIVQEATVNTKVDTYNSLVDALSRLIMTDFSGIYTALNGASNSSTTVNSQVDLLNSHVNIVDTYLGIAIYNRDIGSSGYVIRQPGRYYLAQQIVYNPSATGTSAIFISSNDVILDLNQQTITQTNGASGTATTSGIVINGGTSNIRVVNGFITNVTSSAVLSNGTTNLLISGLNISQTGSTAVNIFPPSQQVVVKDITLVNVSTGIYFHQQSPLVDRNALVHNCIITNPNVYGIGYDGLVNGVLQNSQINNGPRNRPAALAAAVSMGTAARNFVVQNFQITSNSGDAILAFQAQRGSVKNNNLINTNILAGVLTPVGLDCEQSSFVEFIGNTIQGYGNGIGVASAPNNNCLFLDNTLINNTTNVDEVTGGPHTYLGNFAFNPTAVGNPNNTNYTISGSSNITNKFKTVSQKGSFIGYVTGWHNINMLP